MGDSRSERWYASASVNAPARMPAKVPVPAERSSPPRSRPQLANVRSTICFAVKPWSSALKARDTAAKGRVDVGETRIVLDDAWEVVVVLTDGGRVVGGGGVNPVGITAGIGLGSGTRGIWVATDSKIGLARKYVAPAFPSPERSSDDQGSGESANRALTNVKVCGMAEADPACTKGNIAPTAAEVSGTPLEVKHERAWEANVTRRLAVVTGSPSDFVSTARANTLRKYAEAVRVPFKHRCSSSFWQRSSALKVASRSLEPLALETPVGTSADS
jgi:hypothetical protein